MSSTVPRIIFVDDEKNVLKSLERLFMDEEYDIYTAASGEEGLEVIDTSGPFQLVVSDYRMPAMNGVDFLSEVCRRWPDTERIILSGYADTSAIVAAINEGQIYKFIAKPWNDDDLLQTIRDVIDRNALRNSNRRLLEELSAANIELKTINENLNAIVDERIKIAMSQNRVLHSFQAVLDVLPIGFIGTDGCGLIVQCNRLGADMLGFDQNELVGSDLSSTVPPRFLQKVLDLAANSCGELIEELPIGRCHVYITRISNSNQDAIVISLLREQ